MIECVMLDTLPEKANLILNILWDRNHPMSVTELIEALKEEFSLNCEKEAERVTGPDLMLALFARDNGLKHYFYGSSEETLALLKEKLAEKYPHLQIAGMVSPPFRELSEAEDKEMVDQINASGADIIWVGLGAPKQEKWMYAHKDHVNGVMIGVGAGFDYHAGNIKRAPGWMQKLSLEWLYRLLQDPKRLFKRYLVTNTRYLWLIHRK